MTPLATNLRRDLERAIINARKAAESGAQSALNALTVSETKAGSHLDAAGKALRNRLRAHARQLGDARNAKTGEQAIHRLVRECAYEHWHRMLFARFLAENDLLIEPESGVSVSLDDVEELAREQGVKPWPLAASFAQRMLPQIFRADDPVLAIDLPTESLLKLESLLESLPPPVFTADDSLGWTYQFWQAAEKDAVNASGVKIGADELSAVTQLFTEPYMVRFLIHNTLGAWWAGKKLTAEIAESAESEDELRRAVALPGIEWEYLRFVHDQANAENAEKAKKVGQSVSSETQSNHSSAHSAVNSSSGWRPAAGTFPGWPRNAKDLKILDPCCGSGHFLVELLHHLIPIRMAEEGLPLRDAVSAVLRDNLFGLEIDERCTQIAAFALALTAWKMLGKPAQLPPLNIACSGIAPQASEDEWLKLADKSSKAWDAIPKHAHHTIRNGLVDLHEQFSQAPTLGSLINPDERQSDLITADYETLRPFLDAVLAAESEDDEVHERAIAAQGMAKAADILGGDYTLVITNVPYLGRGKQSNTLKQHLEKQYKDAKADLATAFVQRALEACAEGGTTALVTPQNWLFLTTYKKLRETLLKQQEWNFVARLGPKGFQTPMLDFNIQLGIITACKAAAEHRMAGTDVSDATKPAEKAQLLRGDGVVLSGNGMSDVTNDIPESLKDVPEAKKDIPEAKKDVPEAKKDVPEAKKDIPEAKKDIPEAKKDVPEAKKDVPESPAAAPGTPVPGPGSPATPAPGSVTLVPQREQLKNPDVRVLLTQTGIRIYLTDFADSYQGVKTGDNYALARCFWEITGPSSRWPLMQSSPSGSRHFDGCSQILDWTDDGALMGRLQGTEAFGKRGVAIGATGSLFGCIFLGAHYDSAVIPIIPRKAELLPAVASFCLTEQFRQAVRRVDQKVGVTTATVLKVPFDLDHWQKVAAEKYPDGLPEPESDDPTQWLFHGRPDEATPGSELQVAVARLLGYRWPAELDEDPPTMRLAPEARELVSKCDELLDFADDDGIVCLSPVRGEGSAADRLRRLLAAAFGSEPGGWSAAKERELLRAAGEFHKDKKPAANLDQWLRESFFEQHCKLFHHRPFVWHIWDGRKDGFHALVNYHRLCGSTSRDREGAEGKSPHPQPLSQGERGANGRKLLESLTYSYLGDWIKRQQDAVKSGEAGAEARLAAAMELKEELEKILAGEPPQDIFVRWKPLHEQPIGWEPDINDGVRLNIRPFMNATLSKGKKGAGVLRWKPNIKWEKDRGKEPQKLRPREDFPCFWGWDEKTQNFAGGEKFDGNRWNDLHYTNAFKQAARERAGAEAST